MSWKKITTSLCLGALFFATPLAAKRSDGDTIFKAMQDELDRSIKELKLPDAERPYYIEYTIQDISQISAQASFGALISSEDSSSRALKVGMRVGDESLDQSNFDTDESPATYEAGLSFISEEGEYDLLRYELWGATDSAYKTAVEVLGRKKAFLTTKATSKDKVPSFTKTPPMQSSTSRSSINAPSLTKAQVEALSKKLSALFKSYPGISRSSIVVTVVVSEKYYLTTEGTKIYEPSALLEVYLFAEGQAEDGSILQNSRAFYSKTEATRPKDEDLEKAVKSFADDFEKVRSAKTLDDEFNGPILLEGEASGQLLASLLAPALSGTPAPMSELPMPPTESLEPRIGKKVLPANFSLEDDPLAGESSGRPLLGGYKIDDEGVAAQKVSLVESGELKTLLSSRIPSKKVGSSNGHGRGSMVLKPRGHVSNLLLKTTKPEKNLRALAQKEAKAQKAPYVLVIRQFAAPAVLSLEEMIMGGGAEQNTGLPVFYAVKLFPDGKEEIVRGVSLEGVELEDLANIKAASSDTTVYHYLDSLDNGFSQDRDLPGGIATSIVSPALLFAEGIVKSAGGSSPKPYILGHPHFKK